MLKKLETIKKSCIKNVTKVLQFLIFFTKNFDINIIQIFKIGMRANLNKEKLAVEVDSLKV